MRKVLCFLLGLLVLPIFAFSAQNMTNAVEGTVKKIDADSKTLLVKTADGTEHAFHFTDRTSLRYAKDTSKGSREAGQKVAQFFKRIL